MRSPSTLVIVADAWHDSMHLVPTFGTETVTSNSQVQFDRYLSSPDSLVMAQLNFLLSATLKEQIFKKSTELVCRAYTEIYTAVMNPVNQYKEPGAILHRSSQQVHSLLS
ncbi:COG6 protein, partial [Polyodon spathula]|nr:COG6 protein [Polyodon spathula]